MQELRQTGLDVVDVGERVWLEEEVGEEGTTYNAVR